MNKMLEDTINRFRDYDRRWPTGEIWKYASICTSDHTRPTWEKLEYQINKIILLKTEKLTKSQEKICISANKWMDKLDKKLKTMRW